MKKTRRIEILFEILRIIFAMAIAYLLAMLVLLFISKEPIEAIKSFAFGDWFPVYKYWVIFFG